MPPLSHGRSQGTDRQVSEAIVLQPAPWERWEPLGMNGVEGQQLRGAGPGAVAAEAPGATGMILPGVLSLSPGVNPRERAAFTVMTSGFLLPSAETDRRGRGVRGTKPREECSLRLWCRMRWSCCTLRSPSWGRVARTPSGLPYAPNGRVPVPFPHGSAASGFLGPLLSSPANVCYPSCLMHYDVLILHETETIR